MAVLYQVVFRGDLAVFKETNNCIPKTEGGRKKDSGGREGERKGWEIGRGEV